MISWFAVFSSFHSLYDLKPLKWNLMDMWGHDKSPLCGSPALYLHVLETLLWNLYMCPLIGSEALYNFLLTCTWLHGVLHRKFREAQAPHTCNSVSFLECWCDSGWQIEQQRTKAEIWRKQAQRSVQAPVAEPYKDTLLIHHWGTCWLCPGERLRAGELREVKAWDCKCERKWLYLSYHTEVIKTAGFYPLIWYLF